MSSTGRGHASLVWREESPENPGNNPVCRKRGRAELHWLVRDVVPQPPVTPSTASTPARLLALRDAEVPSDLPTLLERRVRRCGCGCEAATMRAVAALVAPTAHRQTPSNPPASPCGPARHSVAPFAPQSLVELIAARRIGVPVRTSRCTHPECFDYQAAVHQQLLSQRTPSSRLGGDDQPLIMVACPICGAAEADVRLDADLMSAPPHV